MKKMKKIFTNKKLLTAFFMLAIVLVTLSTATYTWFFKGGTLLTIEFQTGYVEMQLSLLEGEDFDHDGVLNADTTNGVAEYEPKFTLVPASGIGKSNPITVSGIQSEVQVVELPDISVERLYPGQTYTYKLTMIKKGDVESAISVGLANYADSSPSIDLKEVMSVEAYAKGTEGQALAELNALDHYADLIQGKYLLCGWDTSDKLALVSGVPFLESEEITELDENGNPLRKAEVILKFKFEEEEFLRPVFEAQGISRASFNDYMAGTFSFPNLYITIYSLE